jgi:hypothetical protein
MLRLTEDPWSVFIADVLDGNPIENVDMPIVTCAAK